MLYVAQLIGIDISPHMVEVYNVCANTQGLEPHEMCTVSQAAAASIQHCHGMYPFSLPSNDYLPELDRTFLQCSMVYHHFALVKDVTPKHLIYLKPCGMLAITDILRVEVDEGEPLILCKYEYMVSRASPLREEGPDGTPMTMCSDGW